MLHPKLFPGKTALDHFRSLSVTSDHFQPLSVTFGRFRLCGCLRPAAQFDGRFDGCYGPEVTLETRAWWRAG
eukprot:5951578-Pyramimonas_sp.AAC.1